MHHSSPRELSLVPIASRPDSPVAAASGAGWFDSSWDLRRGLNVQEDFDSDPSPWFAIARWSSAKAEAHRA